MATKKKYKIHHKLKQYVETECKCETCTLMCTRPCWGTPDDILRLIRKGYGDKLMLDWYYGETPLEDDILILCPALRGHEGIEAPFVPASPRGCTFWKNRLCSLHNKSLKPSEGKYASCQGHGGQLHRDIAMTWKTRRAQEIVKKWMKKYKRVICKDEAIAMQKKKLKDLEKFTNLVEKSYAHFNIKMSLSHVGLERSEVETAPLLEPHGESDQVDLE
jgi:hypothetical protein